MSFKILSEKDHVHLRPEILLGTIESLERKFNIYNPETKEYETRMFFFSEGYFRLFEETVTNAVDEYDRSGLVKKISINVQDDYIEVEDDGGGFPIKKHEYDGEERWIPEWILTKLYSGTNFSDIDRNTVGMNGVGISIVNFFSKSFEIETKGIKSRKYSQKFEEHSTKVHVPVMRNTKNNKHYTNIKFVPDMSLFKNMPPDVFAYYMPLFEEYVRKLSMIYPSIKFVFNGKRINIKKQEFFTGILNDHIIKWDKSNEFAFGFTKDGTNRSTYMINSKPVELYFEFETFKTAIFTKVREFLNKKYKLKIARNAWFNENISVVAFFNGKNVRFRNQTKDILVSFDSDGYDFKKADIVWWSKQFISDGEVVKRFLEHYNNTINDQTKKTIKKVRNEFIPKLVEASSKNSEKKILIITEGDSATGGFDSVRDTEYHSLFPIKGKTPNIANMSLAEAFKNEIYKNIISAIQLGTPNNLRHGKVYIATDSDEDGLHIRILLVQFFAKFYPWFIKQNRLFIVVAPRYRYTLNGKTKYSIEEPPRDATNIKYYKGLGSNDKQANNEMLNNPTLIPMTDVDAINDFYKTIYDIGE